MKLAVGVRDLAHLRAIQAERAQVLPPLRHRTRNFPRRAEEIVPGGSIYWVISGVLAVRQHILKITEDAWDDGRPCAALILNPALVPVAPRLVKPFQGWRYLPGGDAPADLRNVAPGRGDARLPETLRRELALLCLL